MCSPKASYQQRPTCLCFLSAVTEACYHSSPASNSPVLKARVAQQHEYEVYLAVQRELARNKQLMWNETVNVCKDPPPLMAPGMDFCPVAQIMSFKSEASEIRNSSV